MSATTTARAAVRHGRREMSRQLARVATRGVRGYARRELQERPRSSNPALRAGQTTGDIVSIILVIVVAAVIGYVGVKVGSTTEDSITDTDLANTNAENQTQFENSTESVTSGFASSMDLVEVVFIVLMLSAVIAVLVGLRGRR